MQNEYYPWSKVVLDEVLSKHRQGKIPTLDIDLTSKCSGASCIYCDSKPAVCANGNLGETDFDEIKEVVLEAKKHGLKFVYSCGLGEPLEDRKFWDMIHLFKSNEICFSIFSNGIFISDVYIAKELKEHNVNIILKMDTFDESKFDKILGGIGISSKIFAARDYLIEAGYGGKNQYTDLAFSIVPTSLSIDGIPEVVRFAKKHGIFASIGELEQAGEVINNHLNKVLGISEEKVMQLKQVADNYIGGAYMRPICPCILTGLHIDSNGNCIVDHDTGFNCKWFLLKERPVVKLGNIKTENIYSIFEKTCLYRKKSFNKKLGLIKTLCDVSYVFGGCGGNPKDIIKLAIETGSPFESESPVEI